jgi:hypothetical protein
MTRLDAETWLKSALNPLNLQIKEHEKVLAKRIENFKKIRDNITSVEDRIKQLENCGSSSRARPRCCPASR